MRSIKIIAIVIALAFTSAVDAEKSVTAIALFDGRAMLSVDGQKAKIIREGNSFLGVTLVSSNTDEAVIEVAGKREMLTLNGSTVISSELGVSDENRLASVQIRENELGFFESLGTVNGRSITFLVDTGASLVVLSSEQANSIGLNYKDGTIGYASTASGNAPMYNIVLNSITVGGIELNNVEAGVIEGRFPERPLLGMTFLSKVNMTRNGSLMTLKKR